MKKYAVECICSKIYHATSNVPALINPDNIYNHIFFEIFNAFVSIEEITMIIIVNIVI